MAAKLKAMTFFVASALCLSAFGCGKSVETPKSAEPEVRAITSSSSPTPSLVALGQATPTPAEPSESPRPPKADEVAGALSRVFNKAVSLDETRAPSFVVGDFNGDGSQDLAVVTKATESALPEINNELANWILEDPR